VELDSQLFFNINKQFLAKKHSEQLEGSKDGRKGKWNEGRNEKREKKKEIIRKFREFCSLSATQWYKNWIELNELVY